MEWRAGMESLSPSTINVRLSAVRKLVGEARRAGIIGLEEAASYRRFWEESFDKLDVVVNQMKKEEVGDDRKHG